MTFQDVLGRFRRLKRDLRGISRLSCELQGDFKGISGGFKGALRGITGFQVSFRWHQSVFSEAI